MASLSLLYPIKSFSQFSPSSSSSFNKCRNQILPCKNSQELHNQPSQFWNPEIPTRRQVLFNIAFTGFTLPAIAPSALCSTDEFTVYTDDANKFQISVPQEWRVGAGEPNGFKSVTAFYPDETSTSNVTVVITGLGPDFTKMESFGKVEEFAETLVGGLDRSWQRPPGVKAKLINCKSSKGIYYIDYTLQNPGESQKHLYSALGMAFNGWYNRLYTVTGQFPDEESDKYGSKIQKAVSSFKFI